MTTTWGLICNALLLASAETPPRRGHGVGAWYGQSEQMNKEVSYYVANPLPGEERTPRGFHGEWFEIYSPPIRTRYSEVFWKVFPPVRLPQHIIDRYNGSTAMAVTGYEVDVVRNTSGGYVSVSCTESYNHHYTMAMVSSQANLIGHGQNMGHGKTLLFGSLSEPAADTPPLVQSFNEHNGNEHRQSYHAYPQGFVQAIHKPESFIFNPMQINTRNPDGSGKVGGPLPKSSQAPPNSSYSGLLECPCTTRTQKVLPTGGRPGAIDGHPYEANCKGLPLSDLLPKHNPTCEVATYVGGMACCTDGTYLLDADQTVPEEFDEVYFKWRFYFQDFDPTYHRSTIHVEWALNGCDSGGPQGIPTGCSHIEYDIPKAAPGTRPEEAIHTITSSWTVRDMLSACNASTDPYCADPVRAQQGLHLVMAGGHCHAPACIDMILVNADTGAVICEVKPVYGKSGHVMDEPSYLWLPPCQWGSADEGLHEPPLLSLETRLTSTKRTNSTYGHYGDMAIWQMRAIYASDGLPFENQLDENVHI